MFALRMASRRHRQLLAAGTRAFGKAKAVKPSIDVTDTKLFIGGQYVDSVSGKTMATLDPRTEKPIAEVAAAQPEDVDKAVAAARKALEEGPWPRMNGFERSKVLWKMAEVIEQNTEYLAQLETWDQGKPLGLAKFDMALCVEHLRYYAGWADKITGQTLHGNSMMGEHFAYTLHQPIGVVGAIIPWNFPLLMAVWKLGPLLATGCTAVIKSAETSPLTALAAAKLFAEAGVPDGVINMVPGLGDVAGNYLASHPGVDKVAFTGSVATGRKVMLEAAKNLKPVTLELGGKSPFILLPDADIDEAVALTNWSLFLNGGQVCTAGSRTFVHESRYDEFVEGAAKMAKERKVGDPFADGMEQGPQHNVSQFEKVLGYLKAGQEEDGATLLAGGKRIGDVGYYVEPTVFGDVTDDMKIAQEEIFGPVMQVLKYKDTDELLARANKTFNGLGAAILGKDTKQLTHLARGIKAGTVWVNTYHIYDANLPFGGFKQSGIGREKGEYALENFTQTKCVINKLDGNGGFY